MKRALSILITAILSFSVFAKSTELKKYKLANQVPVYVQQNTSNRILSVYIVVQGGTALLTPDKSGLENALFAMMARGSAKYPYADVQSIEYKTKASVSPGTLDEGSILGLSCIDYYFDEMLPVLTDGFMNPAYGQTEYTNLMNEYSQRMQSIQNDPNSLLQYTASQMLYKGHPYETSTGVTAESFSNITIQNMKELHKTILDAKRISVVAVGNFDAKDLVKKLNETIGKIPVVNKNFKPATVKPLVVNGSPVVLTHPAAQGTGFLMQAFQGPSVLSADYVAGCIAANIYSELLYNVVREKYGACYTPGSDVTSSQAGVGMVYIYKASDLQNITKYIDEAQNLMEEGKLISGKNQDGSYEYATIEERIEGYRNSYLNEKYEGMQTNGGVAAKIAGSILQFNDPAKYISVMESAKKVTANDVERVFKQYWCTKNYRWFAVVGPENESYTIQ
jgi:zinc protease